MSILIKQYLGIWIIVFHNYRNIERYGHFKYAQCVSNTITSDKKVDYRRALEQAKQRYFN